MEILGQTKHKNLKMMRNKSKRNLKKKPDHALHHRILETSLRLCVPPITNVRISQTPFSIQTLMFGKNYFKHDRMCVVINIL